MHEHRARPAEKSLDERCAVHGGRARRQRTRDPSLHHIRGEHAAIGEQARGAALQRRVHPVSLHQFGQGGMERAQQLAIAQQGKRRSGVVDRHRHRVSRIAIQAGAGRDEAGGDP